MGSRLFCSFFFNLKNSQLLFFSFIYNYYLLFGYLFYVVAAVCCIFFLYTFTSSFHVIFLTPLVAVVVVDIAAVP